MPKIERERQESECPGFFYSLVRRTDGMPKEVRPALMKELIIAAIACNLALASPVRGQQFAQAAPDPVDFRPFTDGQNWIVKEPLIYQVGISKDRVTVPRGFVTDLASIPPVLQSLIQQNGPYLLPAVVHDYLYWKQTCTRAQADRILLLAMIENKVPSVHRTAIYNAVRAAGSLAWADNARERSAHLLRIIPEDRLGIRANTVWPEYRRQLVREGVVDGPDMPIAKGFCARGDMAVEDALQTP